MQHQEGRRRQRVRRVLEARLGLRERRTPGGAPQGAPPRFSFAPTGAASAGRRSSSRRRARDRRPARTPAPRRPRRPRPSRGRASAGCSGVHALAGVFHDGGARRDSHGHRPPERLVAEPDGVRRPHRRIEAQERLPAAVRRVVGFHRAAERANARWPEAGEASQYQGVSSALHRDDPRRAALLVAQLPTISGRERKRRRTRHCGRGRRGEPEQQCEREREREPRPAPSSRIYQHRVCVEAHRRALASRRSSSNSRRRGVA